MRRCLVFMSVLCLVVLQPVHEVIAKDVPAPAVIKVEKGARSDRITMTGSITSVHSRFRLGRSVRAYSLLTKDGRKVRLPRSHTVHRDGSISGINFSKMGGCNVVVVCTGKATMDGDNVLAVKVKKVLSVTRILPPKPPSLLERFGKKPEPDKH